MKKILLLLSFTISISCINAQTTKSKIDSVRFYSNQLRLIDREYHDSMKNDPAYKTAIDNLNRLRRTPTGDNYVAFIIHAQFSSADFKKLNSDNALSNFGPMSGYMASIGYGFSVKNDKNIFDFNISAFGVNKEVEKGNESIRASFSTFFQFEYGYDLIKSNAVNLYPYVGIGIRGGALRYTTPRQTNNSFTNISDILQGNASAIANSVEGSYQAGLGLEVVTSKSSKPGGTIIFVKAGTNQAFVKKSYRIENQRYNPQLNYGVLNFSAGLKLFGRY